MTYPNIPACSLRRSRHSPVVSVDPFESVVSQIFSGGDVGVAGSARPSVGGSQRMYQDSAGAVPVSSDGDRVALIRDVSGNGFDLVQSVEASRPIYRTDGTLHWLEGDGSTMHLSSPSMQFNGGGFFASSGMAILESSEVLAGPWRMYSQAGGDNVFEEYSLNTEVTRKVLRQRYPSDLPVYLDTAARPGAGVSHLSWCNQGASFVQQVAPSQASPVDIGPYAIQSGESEFQLFRGRSGYHMAGRIYAFIIIMRELSGVEIDAVNTEVSLLSGVVV